MPWDHIFRIRHRCSLQEGVAVAAENFRKNRATVVISSTKEIASIETPDVAGADVVPGHFTVSYSFDVSGNCRERPSNSILAARKFKISCCDTIERR